MRPCCEAKFPVAHVRSNRPVRETSPPLKKRPSRPGHVTQLCCSFHSCSVDVSATCHFSVCAVAVSCLQFGFRWRIFLVRDALVSRKFPELAPLLGKSKSYLFFKGDNVSRTGNNISFFSLPVGQFLGEQVKKQFFLKWNLWLRCSLRFFGRTCL